MKCLSCSVNSNYFQKTLMSFRVFWNPNYNFETTVNQSINNKRGLNVFYKIEQRDRLCIYCASVYDFLYCTLFVHRSCLTPPNILFLAKKPSFGRFSRRNISFKNLAFSRKILQEKIFSQEIYIFLQLEPGSEIFSGLLKNSSRWIYSDVCNNTA